MNSATVLTRLLDTLWAQYKTRVVYAAQYQKMVEERKGRVINDHIAFRAFNGNVGGQPRGVEAIARVLIPLGYEAKDTYIFYDKHLTAWHYEHQANPEYPKIFISQLENKKLSPKTLALVEGALANAPDLLSAIDLELLKRLGSGSDLSDDDGTALVTRLFHFFSRPWKPPPRSIIAPVNEELQYAAWTLLHGNSVNHFTAYINGQNVKEWPDLESTVNALREAGLPMKDEIEGEPGSKLRQSSTQAIGTECQVTEKEGGVGMLNWSYAYYELAERGMVKGRDGQPKLFQAFLGAQATNLFEMTKRG